MKLVVVRHYKTLNNQQQRIMGWGDSPPAPGWQDDLLAVEQKLKRSGLDFSEVHTSDLERARRSGAFYAQRAHIPVQQADPDLNEVDYGRLFQKSKKWVRHHIPQYKTDPDYVFEDGESFRQMQQRSVRHITELAKRHRNETLLVVVHAGVIRGLICHFCELPYAANLARRVSHRYIGVFDFAKGHFQRYDELGSHSDFVNDGVIALPYGKGH